MVTTKKITVKAKSTTAKKSSTSKNTKPSSSKKVVEATSVKITGPQEVYVKESIKLSATVSPSNTTNKTVTWKSSNTSIATVDKNGKVTGVKDGEITITAMTSNGKTATYKVTVKSRYQLTLKAIPVEGVEGTVYQYTFTVTKNGNAFTDYAGFEINGHGYRKVTSNPTVAAGHVSKGQNSATITLSNGEKKNLIVKIN